VVSEYTFSNLFAWRHAYEFCLSRIDEALLVVSCQGGALSIFDPLMPSGPGKRRIALAAARAAGGFKNVRFIRLPEDTALSLRQEKAFVLEEDADQFDYVYRAKDLVALQGAAYDGKRNFIRRFKDNYDYEFLSLRKENLKDCFYFEEEWCQAKDCQRAEGLEKERQAMHQMLEHFEQLGIRGAMLRIQGKVEAVTLGEPLNPQTFVVHIEKANGRFTGIYQAINQMFCEQAARDYQFINREQDLGIAGLRKAKQSYHPAFLVKKYTATVTQR